MSISESASKIAFIMLTFTACVAFLMGIVFRFIQPETTAGLPVDQFMLLAAGASAFYFANKGDPTKEFAGK